MSDTLRLEGFAESLKSRRIYCVGTPNLLPALVRSRISIVDTEVAHRGRKVLFIQDGNSNAAWLLRMKWDAVIVLKDSQDLRLGLTYVINAGRPTRLVWAASTEPQASVFAHLAKCEGLTLIGLGSAQPISQEWEAVFCTHDTTVQTVEQLLLSRLGSQVMDKYNLHSVMKEIQASEVGLVWASIGDSDKRGTLYWFDPAEGFMTSLYSPQEAADLSRSLADSVVGFGAR